MAQVKNNKSNVSAIKGVMGGYFFSAPLGTKIPTDLKTPLNEAFVNIGYISEDGISGKIDIASKDTKDMNGDTVDTTITEFTETFELTFIEVKKDALAEVYGHKNVEDKAGIITVKHNSKDPDERIGLMELVLKNGRRQRTVIPRYKRTEIGDITYGADSVSGRSITLKAIGDEEGNTTLDIIESTETSA